MGQITSLVVGDPPGLWTDLGFLVVGGGCWVSGVRHELGGDRPGLSGWTLRHISGLAELPIGPGEGPPAEATPRHPNGVVGLDHVVVTTPDLGRTIEALETAGIELRRTRATGAHDRPMTQAFFKLGEVIVEVVGPSRSAEDGPATFFGLAFTVADLDQTASYLGNRLRPATDAVQEGRRIAALDRGAGSSVPIVFMSPRPPRGDRTQA